MDDIDEVLDWAWAKGRNVGRAEMTAEVEAARSELAASMAGLDTYRASVAGVEALRDELAAARSAIADHQTIERGFARELHVAMTHIRQLVNTLIFEGRGDFVGVKDAAAFLEQHDFPLRTIDEVEVDD